MAVLPRQLLSLDYVWRGAPKVSVAATSIDTLSLDYVWRAAPSVADAVQPEPVTAWGAVMLELGAAASSGVTEMWWGAPQASLAAEAATSHTVSVTMHSDVYATSSGTMTEVNVSHADTYLSVSATIYGAASWIVMTGWARSEAELEVRAALELVASCLVARHVPLDLAASYAETQTFSVRVVEGHELAASGVDAFHYDAVLVTEDGARAVLVKCR